MNDNLVTAATTARQLASSLGIDLEDLVGALRADPGELADSATGRTVAEYVPEVLQAMASDRSETRRTYKIGFDLLANGIVLHWPYRHRKTEPMTHKPWADDRVADWLAAADRVNRKDGLGLELPARVEDCRRSREGAAIIWPGYGDVPLAALTESQVRIAIAWVQLRAKANAAVTNAGRVEAGRAAQTVSGDGAARNLVCAVRYLYQRAAGDNLVPRDRSPGAGVKISGGRSGSRTTISAAEVAEALAVMAETGYDPELDAWLGRYHLLTGSRQEGGYRLERRMIDRERQLIYVPDKNSPVKRGQIKDPELWAMPVPREMVDGLLALAASRGSTEPEDYVFVRRRRDPSTGKPLPITSRHYDVIYRRIRKYADWADGIGFGVHHLRHHQAAQVEAIAHPNVKMRFLRHAPNGQTDRCGMADLGHLAWAMATLTGHPHPLSTRPDWVR